MQLERFQDYQAIVGTLSRSCPPLAFDQPNGQACGGALRAAHPRQSLRGLRPAGRPPVCLTLKPSPSPSMLGADAAAALRMLTLLERATAPA